MNIFNLPDLGEGLTEAEIHEWHVKEGDEVHTDEPLVSMETAKAVVEVPSPHTGKIKKLHGKAGDIIPVGAPLVEYEAEGKKDTGTVAGKIETSEEVVAETAKVVSPTVSAGAASGAGVKALPAVRMLAKTLGVDLSKVTGTGTGGAITAEDIKHAVPSLGGQAATAAPLVPQVPGMVMPSGPFEQLKGTRRIMAQTMIAAHAQVVPVSIFDDADIQDWPAKTDITARVIRALVAGCKEEPALNAYYKADDLSRQISENINIGLAMDTPDGLFVPIIRDADKQDPTQLRERINTLKQQVGDRSIPPADLQGHSITLTNFGMFAARYACPVVVPPTVAILGTGKIRESVLPVDGSPQVRRVIPLSLTFDHRAVTGGEATRFLSIVIKDLESAD